MFRHRLLPERRLADARTVVDALLAVHSSDPATVFLTIAARMSEPSIGAIERAMHDDRSVVRHHAFRRTLWVMAPDIAQAAHSSATAKIAAAERRTLLRIVAQSPDTPVSNERDAATWCGDALVRVRGFIAENGPTTTREIGRRFPELTVPLTLGAGTKHAGQAAAHTRVLLLAGFEAELTRTAPINGWNTAEYAWSETNEWLGQSLTGAQLRESAALILLAWLERFGPATETDIRWWSGWTVTQMKMALADIEAEAVEVGDGHVGWIAAGDIDVPDVDTSVALLPGLDVTTMGWKERGWYLSDHAADRTFDRSSNAGPTIWRNGEVVGGWAHRADGSVAIELYAPLTAPERRILDDEIGRFTALVGDTHVRPRFPSRNQRELLASDWPR